MQQRRLFELKILNFFQGLKKRCHSKICFLLEDKRVQEWVMGTGLCCGWTNQGKRSYTKKTTIHISHCFSKSEITEESLTSYVIILCLTVYIGHVTPNKMTKLVRL